MSIAPHTRFAFDTVFDHTGDVAYSAPRPKQLYPADEVELIRAAAFAEGERSALAGAAALQARALVEIADACGRALPKLAEVAHSHREASADLALACARSIAAAALDRFPQAPIQDALVALAREIEAAPRLVISCAPELAEGLQAAIAETLQAIGYAGAVQIRPQGHHPAGAFTFDFGDGAAAFDPEAAAARVAQALSGALAAEGLHAEPLIPSTES